MLLIHCPYCGEERPELEFRHAGEAHIARSASITEVGDEEFEAFLYLRTNTKGLVYERWRHVHGCGRFFNAVRDSVTDRFFTTYKAGQPKPDPARFAKAVAAVEPLVAEVAGVAPEPRQQPAAPARAPRKPGSAAAPAAGPAPEPAAKAVATEPVAPVTAKPKPARARKTAAPTSAEAPASAADLPSAAPKPRRGRATTPTAAPEPLPDEAPAARKPRKTPVKKGEA